MNGYIPPQNLDAEMSVLGAIMIDNAVIDELVEIIAPDDFYKQSSRIIYEVMLNLFQLGEPIDLITVSNFLAGSPEFVSAGGAAYLAGLVDSTPTSANVIYYASIVREKSIRRKGIAAANKIISMAVDEQESVDEFIDRSEKAVYDVSGNRGSDSVILAADAMAEIVETIETVYNQRSAVVGVSTGYIELDRITSGLQASDLIIIAGRPGMGKTSLALNIAFNVASSKTAALVFSLEMAREQLIVRTLCSEARVNWSKVRTGYFGRRDFPRLFTAATAIAEARLFIDDTPSISALALRAKARRLAARESIGLIVVDYLQLMRGVGDTYSREQEISEISRSLKALAKELKVPVVALSQLNRKVEDRGDRRPQLSDLRESGAIEQDADVVIFIYRDEVYSKEKNGEAEIIIAKQRNGPTGTVLMAFQGEITRFDNLARETGSGER